MKLSMQDIFLKKHEKFYEFYSMRNLCPYLTLPVGPFTLRSIFGTARIEQALVSFSSVLGLHGSKLG